MDSPTDLPKEQQHETPVVERATDPRKQPALAPMNTDYTDADNNDPDKEFIRNGGAFQQNQQQQTYESSSRDDAPNRLNPNKHEDG